MTRPLLVADMGGTHARFAWMEAGSLQPLDVRVLPVADHAGPAQAMMAYLDQTGRAHRLKDGGLLAAWGVATAVLGDRVEFTNNAWAFSVAEVQARTGLAELRVVNDFEALAASLPHLLEHQFRAWDARRADAGEPLAVVGPGTGLGVAAVRRTPAGWQPLTGQGGHATLSAADEFEAEILKLARQVHNHVSAERLISGTGLPLLHRCVSQVEGLVVSERSAADIIHLGLQGEPACSRTIDVLCDMLGSFAGNVALLMGARGGVYIGGGIVPRLGDRFFASGFRQRFEAKGRYREYLSAIPTLLITDTLAALQGAARAAYPQRAAARCGALGPAAGCWPQ